jgi:hypothetical protein
MSVLGTMRTESARPTMSVLSGKSEVDHVPSPGQILTQIRRDVYLAAPSPTTMKGAR